MVPASSARTVAVVLTMLVLLLMVVQGVGVAVGQVANGGARRGAGSRDMVTGKRLKMSPENQESKWSKSRLMKNLKIFFLRVSPSFAEWPVDHVLPSRRTRHTGVTVAAVVVVWRDAAGVHPAVVAVPARYGQTKGQRSRVKQCLH